METCINCIHHVVCDESPRIWYYNCPYYAKDKHGYWITSWYEEEPKIEHGKLVRRKHKISECSECKVEIVGLINMDYCPDCGAKMDEQKDKEERKN